MKKKIEITLFFLFSILLIVSCKKPDYELGAVLNKSDIKFEVVQDLATDPGGNTVILINNTPSTVSMWDYGTGKSNRQRDTVNFAFKGDYVINFSVLTAGGVIALDPITVKVTDDNLNYVNDPLWLALTGGPGFEKSWVLDTETKFFDGPLSFYGLNNGWLLGGNAWDGGATGCYGDDCWNWSPDAAWAFDNAMTPGDYGVMTFSLIGGPYFKAVKPMEAGKTENGTYYLDVNSKTLNINDASILRGYKPAKNGLTGVSNWSRYTVLALDENTLRLGVIRDKDVDGEGPAMIVYNFISKEYSDNWMPEAPVETGPDEGFDPVFSPGELLDILTGGPSSGRLWKLDAAGNPIDWIGGGKGWTVDASSSDDWGWNSTWTAVANNSWIRFDRYGGQNYTRNQSGTVTNGTFTINEETNEITLVGNTLIQNPGNWIDVTQNVIKVVKAFPTETETKGIWFGTSYDEEKDEWLAFHYIIPID